MTAAASRFEEALAIGREIDDSAVIAAALGNLGIVADQQGAYGRAAERYEEAGVATEIEGLAAVAATVSEPGRAARLNGAAEALREEIGVPLPPDDRADYDRSVAAAHSMLDDAKFATNWEAGHRLSLDDAVNEALALAREIAGAGSLTPP